MEKHKYQIIFTRHGKAEHNTYNGKDSFAGQRCDTDLTEEGKNGAELLAKKILGKFHPDLIFYSRLRRSRQTAEIISDEIFKDTGIRPTVVKIDNLEEIDVGGFTGMQKSEALSCDRKAAEAFYRNDIENFDFPNGENFASLQNRAKKLIDSLNKNIKPDQKAVVVGHGMFNRIIFYTLMKNKIELWKNIDHPHDLLVCMDGPLNCIRQHNDKKPKTVLFVSWYFYPKVGGAETMILNQARCFADKGYKVMVLTSLVESQSSQENIFNITILRRDYMRALSRMPKDQIKGDFSAILAKYCPEIIHFHNGSYPAGVKDKSIGVEVVETLFETATDYGAKIIEHAHNTQINQPEITKPLRDLPWDIVICVSQFVKEKWLQLSTGAKKIDVVYNGIDLKRFANAKPNSEVVKIKQSGEFVIFFPARIFRMSTGEIGDQKNFMLVLEACRKFKEISKTNFRLLAVSNHKSINAKDTDSKEKLEKIVREYNLEDNVIFVPSISPDEISSYYAGVDVVCVPSLDETFGLVYMEAMATGAIAIASNTGGPREYIENDKNGFLVDPTDEIALAKLFIKLSQDKDLAKKIKRNAKITSQSFSTEHMCKKIEKIYNEIR